MKIQFIEKYYNLFVRALSSLQSPFLLAVRLYWGWQFMQTGWGKLTYIGKVIHLLYRSRHTCACIERVLCVGSRVCRRPSSRARARLTAHRPAAHDRHDRRLHPADREALFSIISNPDKFTAAAPYTFLVASLLVLIFGPGKLSFDTLLAARLKDQRADRSTSGPRLSNSRHSPQAGQQTERHRKGTARNQVRIRSAGNWLAPRESWRSPYGTTVITPNRPLA